MKRILFFVCLVCMAMFFANVCGATGLTVSADCKTSPMSYSYGMVTKAQSGVSFPIVAKYYSGDGGGFAIGIEADWLSVIGSSLLGGIYYGYDYLLTGDNKGMGIISYGLKLVIRL